MKLSFKKLRVLLLVGLVCVPLVAALPNIAHAIDPAGSGTATTGGVAATTAGAINAAGINTKAPTVGDYIQNFFLGLLGAIQGLIVYFLEAAAIGVRWMIDFGTTVMTFPVVISGFEVTLSLVNLLFVMALIIISFEIILDFHAGEAKKTLGKLILAALLINFSLLIAGFLLDISNIFTNFFINDITAETLTAAFNPQKFGGAIFGTDFWPQIASLLFTIIMTGVILITMSAIFIMATVRTIIVAGLLLLMPITWGMWIFPGMKEHHKDWWTNFLKYGVSYLPTLTFFLYLAISTSANLKLTDPSNPLNDKSVLGGVLGSVMQLVLLIGIIIFGLKTAEKAGGVGADLGINMAKKIGGGAGRGLARGVVSARIPMLGGDKTLRGAGKSLSGFASRQITSGFLSPLLKRIPGAMGLANKASESAHYDHNIDEFAKQNLSHMSYEQLRDYEPPTDIGRAAKLKQLAALGKTSDFIGDPVGRGQAGMEEMLRASMRMNHKEPGHNGNPNDAPLDIEEIKKAVEASPALAASMGIRSVTEQIGRMSAGKIADLHHSNFTTATAEGRELIAAVGNNAAAVKALMTNGTDLAKAAFRAGMAELNSGAALPALPGVAGSTTPPLRGTILTNRDIIETEDIEIRRLISIGAKSTLHPEHDDLNDAKARRELAIAAIQTSVDGIRTSGAPDAVERAARIAGIVSGEAVMRQVVTRDTGGIINP